MDPNTFTRPSEANCKILETPLNNCLSLQNEKPKQVDDLPLERQTKASRRTKQDHSVGVFVGALELSMT